MRERACLVRFSIFLLFLVSCASVPKNKQGNSGTAAVTTTTTISREEFAANPFGFRVTIKNFETNYRKVLKRQRYFIENSSNASQIDTIYSYYKFRTKVFFYKHGHFEGRLMGGKIRKPQVELNNGIRVGLTRKEFFGKFSDWSYDESKRLTLDAPAIGCKFTFVFSRNILKEIKFTAVRPKSRSVI
jgi:hypothetical protein